MGLFKPDLYRSFAIGFVLGALAIGYSVAPEWEAEFAGKAHAAEAHMSDLEADSGRIMQVK